MTDFQCTLLLSSKLQLLDKGQSSVDFTIKFWNEGSYMKVNLYSMKASNFCGEKPLGGKENNREPYIIKQV